MPQPPSAPLLLTLKAATWHRHQRFDRIPFIAALGRGTLPLAAYVAQLRAMAIVVGALERSLAASPDPLVIRLRPLLARASARAKGQAGPCQCPEAWGRPDRDRVTWMRRRERGRRQARSLSKSPCAYPSR